MQRIALTLVMLAGGGVATSVEAASPDYCAFYAREYVAQFKLGADEATLARDLGDQAYFRCLNLDRAPALPEQSAYAGSPFDAGSPASEFVAQGDSYMPAEDTDMQPEIAELLLEEIPPTEIVVATPAPQRSRSGLKPWSAEWRSWCERHFPNSFDPSTGYVRPFRGAPGFC
ncbi:MAG: hypothetical protein ACTSP2_06220 [Alphaproteobacteria bacterium]